jgi:hypothetical protein
MTLNYNTASFSGSKFAKSIMIEHLLTETEKSARLTFNAVFLNFLGNVKAENYKEFVEDLLNAYQTIGCNMSLKFHPLHSHLDFFPLNLGAMSKEHGEKGPPGYFHHGENICRKVVVEHVS